MFVLAIIPARGGSKGIPRKNIVNLEGKPLIQFSIEAALASKHIDKVIVSSDDQEILFLSQTLRAEVVERPAYIAGDCTSMNPVIAHVLKEEKNKGFSVDIVILLQPTSPLRTSIDIDKAYELIINKGARSLISVYESDKSLLKSFMVDNNGFLKGCVNEKYPFMRRQDLPKIFLTNGAIYIFKVKDFMENEEIPVKNAIPYVMDEEKSIDIDTPEDLVRASIIFKRMSYE